MSATGWSATFWNVNDAIARGMTAVCLLFCLKWHFNFSFVSFLSSLTSSTSTFSRLCQYIAQVCCVLSNRLNCTGNIAQVFLLSLSIWLCSINLLTSNIWLDAVCIYSLIQTLMKCSNSLHIHMNAPDCVTIQMNRKKQQQKSSISVWQRLNRQRNMDQLSQYQCMHHELVCIAAHRLDVLVHSFELRKCSDRLNCLFAPLSRYFAMCSILCFESEFQVQR